MTRTGPSERPWLAALAVLTLVRLAVAGIAPLAPDEAYYWVWSRALAPGYVDHPPMVALWIRLGTLVAGPTPLGVRLLGPLAAALGSLLLADAAERLLPGRGAGRVAALLLNATLLFGVGAVIMTPDTPLLFFWTTCLWAVARGREGPPAWWLAAGLFAGLALASKYTAVLLIGGIGLWLVVLPDRRRMLTRFAPWCGLLIAGAVFLPVVLWNEQHGWASFLRQGGRVTDWEPARAAQFLGELVGGQIGLATPVVFLLSAAGTLAATREAWRRRAPGETLLTALTLPGALVFLQHALGDRVQGNWPAVLYPAAIIAAAGLSAPVWRRMVVPGAVLGLLITALVYVQATTGLLPLPPRLDPIARQLAGWDSVAAQVAGVAREQGAGWVAVPEYAVASELAWHLRAGPRVIGADPRWGVTALPPATQVPAPGLLLWPAYAPPPTGWPGAARLGTVSRDGQALLLYRTDGLPDAETAAWLPQRDADERQQLPAGR